MKESKLISIIGFITQTQIALFWEKAVSPAVFNFPQGSVSDYEVRKADDLASAFEIFLEQNKFPPSQIYFIVSADQVFEGDFPAKDPESASVEIDQFVKSVPFEHVAHRVYRFGKGCRVLAINRELYETLQSVLESRENAVVAVTPATVLIDYLKSGLNISSMKQLLSKADFIRQNSFIYQEEATAEMTQQASDPRKNKKLLALLLIFVTLLAALGVLVYITMFANQKPKEPLLQNQKTSTENPPPAPVSKTDEATTSAITANTLKIQILNASGITGRGSDVKKQLEQTGFSNVQITDTTEINGAKNSINFNETVPTALREQIANTLLKTFPGIATTETKLAAFDAVITLTKNAASTGAGKIAP